MKIENVETGYCSKSFSQPTKRYCQTLDLREDPSLIKQYRLLHSRQQVWQETLDAIRSVGILEMEIYLVGARLFMVVETPVDFNWQTAMARLSSMPRQTEWEALTATYQKASSHASSAEKWQLMERIFYLYDD